MQYNYYFKKLYFSEYKIVMVETMTHGVNNSFEALFNGRRLLIPTDEEVDFDRRNKTLTTRGEKYYMKNNGDFSSFVQQRHEAKKVVLG